MATVESTPSIDSSKPFDAATMSADIAGTMRSKDEQIGMPCRLHGNDPYTYLIDVLQRVGQHSASRVAELTPRLWKTLFADNRCAPLHTG